MSYKFIVLVASGESDDPQVFDAAAKLAKLQQGHVRVIPVYPDPAADLVYYGVVMHKASKASAEARMRESEREIQSRLERFAREAATRHGLTFGSQASGPSIALDNRDFGPAVALAEAAVLADLVVIGARCARDFLSFGALFSDTLLTSRAPVLLVKEGVLNFERVAIAWDGSNQAGRAVKAALPVLHTANEIVVLQHHAGIDNAEEAADPDTLIAYLGRHGLSNVRFQTLKGADVTMALLAGAREADCRLLVAGGYGRPRLFELVLGGTTRGLVDAEGQPHLILAH